MTTVADPAAEREIRNLRVELLKHLHAYREAKARFNAVTLAYELQYGGDGEFMAKDDYRRVKAAADCSWYHGEASLAAAALTALCLSERAS